MSENWPIVLIEGIIVFGGALAFAWWQLRDIKRDQRIAAEKKAEMGRAEMERAEMERAEMAKAELEKAEIEMTVVEKAVEASASLHASPQEVLDFWLGATGTAERGSTRPLWFKKSAETDALIRTRFGAAVEAALAAELDHWAQDLHGALALIVLLDQFTRNIFRDTPRAFAGDAAALALAQRLTDTGLDRQLSLHERWFVYLPFEHAESLDMQERAVQLFRQLATDGLAEPLDWAIKHRDVVARFGRFPHRNAVLGRTTTPEEETFLRQPGSRF